MAARDVLVMDVLARGEEVARDELVAKDERVAMGMAGVTRVVVRSVAGFIGGVVSLVAAEFVVT